MHYRLNRSFFPWIVAHVFEYWYYYIGAVTSLFALHHFSSELPMMAKELGDLAMSDKLDEIQISNFVLLAVYILFFRTMSRLLFFYPARVQQRNLRMELVSRVETAFPRNYKNYNEGMLFQTIWNDLNRIRGFMGFALLQIGNIIIAGTIFVPKIKSFNPEFLLAFTPLLVCVVLFSILIYIFHPYMKKGMDQYADVQKFLIECYEAKKTIQNYHSEKDFFKVFNDTSNIELRTFFISTMGRVISFPLIKIGVGASLIWAALIVRNNDLVASDLIFFSSFLFLVLEPLMFLSWIGIVASQGYAAWTRIKEMISDLDKPIDDKFLTENNSLEAVRLPLWGNNELLNLPKDRWTVLIGETGSGKSWLLEKYAELLQVKGAKYSFIHQEPYLYNDTIAGNLFLGQEKTPEKVERAKFFLKEFGLDILSSNMDDLLNMELGENGKRVSGGQAKRISLIRSLIADVDFILWDDPFSSVDLILEAEILKKLKNDNKLKNVTFIFTSHRLSTVKACHHIIYIDKSKGILSQGERDELLNGGTEVDEFFKKQLV